MNAPRSLARLVVACALTVLAAAPASADIQASSNRGDDSHPLPADRAEEAEDDDYPYYINCNLARSESRTPLFAGQPGYSLRLDDDGDGLACEVGEG